MTSQATLLAANDEVREGFVKARDEKPTNLPSSAAQGIEESARRLREGRLVAFPTETVKMPPRVFMVSPGATT